ncbi:hypothetical protein ACQPXS_06175 [Streptomyces sp. CA-142005]|uniref:hypothetical protein n=1 Tax=Streptomyces sp. CA-142005 TaxID=3240052 RepID=UPI003D9450DE
MTVADTTPGGRLVFHAFAARDLLPDAGRPLTSIAKRPAQPTTPGAPPATSDGQAPGTDGPARPVQRTSAPRPSGGARSPQ